MIINIFPGIPDVVETMTLFLGLLLIIFSIIWRRLFSARSYTTKKSYKVNKNKVQETLSLSDIQRKQIKFRAFSNALNALPFGNLTETKRIEINSMLGAIKTPDKVIKTAEEVHCEQWLAVAYYGLVVAFLAIVISPYCTLGIFLCPIAFKWNYWMLKAQVSDEEYELDTEFRNFFNIYYVQYRRVGNNVKLLDVVKSYMTVAPSGMQLFCNRLMTDLANGEVVALRNMDRRYIKNSDVHRFCAIAQMISNGDANSDKVIDSFRENLNRKKLMRQRRELNKNKARVETVTTAILYAVCMTMMGIVFIFMAKV